MYVSSAISMHCSGVGLDLGIIFARISDMLRDIALYVNNPKITNAIQSFTPALNMESAITIVVTMKYIAVIVSMFDSRTRHFLKDDTVPVYTSSRIGATCEIRS